MSSDFDRDRFGSQTKTTIDNIRGARSLVDLATPLNLISFAQDADILFFGEAHNDYSIPQFLLSQVGTLRGLTEWYRIKLVFWP